MRTTTHQPDHGPAAFSPPDVSPSLDGWGRLLLLEPALAELARQAAAGGDHRRWLAIGERLIGLAGPLARRESLRSVTSYQTASNYLHQLFERAAARKRERR